MIATAMTRDLQGHRRIMHWSHTLKSDVATFTYCNVYQLRMCMTSARRGSPYTLPLVLHFLFSIGSWQTDKLELRTKVSFAVEHAFYDFIDFPQFIILRHIKGQTAVSMVETRNGGESENGRVALVVKLRLGLI